ncbi:4Fe-4S cluster-binding domain-containing protein [Campylobacter jejuni]|uniref:Radical SAM protein n=1 Tax=Campylobacter jejuni TaxID=197 RepID=A0A431EAB6_CAMJU|nr:4Fe-4S cluster-binding domain-containing protein [Campylobacter jejuni]RTJ78027.1 hypothetical protein C3H57_09475 [Campylobacter jejuni]
MKTPKILGITPSTGCNLRCKFCYLKKEDLADMSIVPFSVNRDKIISFLDRYEVRCISLYGGELLQADEEVMREYVMELYKLVVRYRVEEFIFFTNLTKIPVWVFSLPPNVRNSITISYSHYPYLKLSVSHILRSLMKYQMYGFKVLVTTMFEYSDEIAQAFSRHNIQYEKYPDSAMFNSENDLSDVVSTGESCNHSETLFIFRDKAYDSLEDYFREYGISGGR